MRWAWGCGGSKSSRCYFDESVTDLLPGGLVRAGGCVLLWADDRCVDDRKEQTMRL